MSAVLKVLDDPLKSDDAKSLVLLKDSLVSLKSILEDTSSKTTDIDQAFASCAEIDSYSRAAHVVYHEIGELALNTDRLDIAESFAVRALKLLPRYGAGYKLVGMVLRARGNLEEAAICHRHSLPYSILDKWFIDPPCEWVQSYEITDGSVKQSVAFPSVQMPMNPPVQWQPYKLSDFAQETKEVVEGCTLTVPDGALWFDTFNTVVWTGNRKIVQDACRGHSQIINTGLRGREPLKLDGRVCLLGNRSPHNYYHWMNDIVPRLAVLEKSGYPLDSIDYFVINRLSLPFQTEALEAFGIHPDRIHVANDKPYVQADELLIAMYGCNKLGIGQGSWNHEFLQRTFAPAIKPAQSLRLYISRGSKGARGISNESELLDFLKPYGFQIVRAEKMSIREQAELFSAASVVLGPHGAGFSNIAFCQPETKVIELFNKHIEPCFWAISELIGMSHYIHYCGQSDVSAFSNECEEFHRSAEDRRLSRFSVNIQEVEKLLEYAGVQ